MTTSTIRSADYPTSAIHAAEPTSSRVANALPRAIQFPHFPEKHAEPSVTGPEVFGNIPLEQVPKTVVLCLTKFLDAAVDRVLSNHPNSSQSKVFSDLHFLNPSVALLRNKMFLGAPLATVVLERLIHLGVRNFLILGIAGSLREGTNIGQVVVCDKAVRDEGTSYHYLPPSEFAFPASALSSQLTSYLREQGLDVQVGGTWTTDAIFRETPLEVRRLAAKGILTVEMEASALFSVAQYRQVNLGAVFVVSDLVHRKTWERGMDGEHMSKAIDRLLPHLVAFAADQIPLP